MIIIFLTLFVLIVTYIFIKNQKPKNFPPGPQFIPIIGHVQKVKKLSKFYGGQHLAFSQLAKEYNTNVLGLKFGNELTVVVHSYPVIKTVLTEEVFEGRPDNFFMRLRTMGTRKGITGVDGDLWNIQRNFIVKHLKILGFGKEIMSTHIKNEIVDLIKKLPNDGTQIKKFLAPSVINIFWNLTSGSKITGNDKRVEKLIELLNKRSNAFDMAGGILNIFPWLRYIVPEMSGYELIRKMNQELDDLFRETIDGHYKTWSEDKTDDLIYVYITEIKNQRDTFDDEQLVMVLLDLFIAGSQTTSTTIDFAIMMMILRPDIQEKAYGLLQEAFEKNKAIDYSERHRVPYIEAILMETMRYFLIVPVIGPRRTLRETYLDGYRLPKDTTVLINLSSLNDDKSYWKDPELFRPERFIDENGKLIYNDRNISFGLGRRRCLGEVLARNCLFIFFSEIVRNYKITLQPGSETPSLIPQPGIVLSPQPYLANFIKRLD